jgi:hypothetical protein
MMALSGVRSSWLAYDVHLQGILADDRARPHAIEQLGLGYDLAVRADQNLEQLEGAAADGRELSVSTKFAPGKIDGPASVRVLHGG